MSANKPNAKQSNNQPKAAQHDSKPNHHFIGPGRLNSKTQEKLGQH